MFFTSFNYKSYAQSNLVGLCSAEAFNSDFLVEVVTIPRNIAKSLGFRNRSSIKGIRANVLCKDRYQLTRVSIKLTTNGLRSHYLITDKNYKILQTIKGVPGERVDITQTVCNKTIYYIPAMLINNSLRSYDVIDKSFSSNIIDGRCVVNNNGTATERSTKTKSDFNISRIFSDIGKGYQKPY